LPLLWHCLPEAWLQKKKVFFDDKFIIKAPPLTAIITPDVINEIAADPEAQKVLIPLLPKDQQTPEGLLENLRSAQFLQGLNALTAVFLFQWN